MHACAFLFTSHIVNERRGGGVKLYELLADETAENLTGAMADETDVEDGSW